MYQQSILAVYKAKAPDKLNLAETYLVKYEGKEEELYQDVCKKFQVDPKDFLDQASLQQPLKYATGDGQVGSSEMEKLETDHGDLPQAAKPDELHVKSLFRKLIEKRLDDLMDAGADVILDEIACQLGNDPWDDDPLNLASLTAQDLQDLSSFVERKCAAEVDGAGQKSRDSTPEGILLSTETSKSEPVIVADCLTTTRNGTTMNCTDCGWSFQFYQDDCLACPCGGFVCLTCLEKYGDCRQYSGQGSHPLYRTRTCKFFLKGVCPYGRKCYFIHGPSELRSSSACASPAVEDPLRLKGMGALTRSRSMPPCGRRCSDLSGLPSVILPGTVDEWSLSDQSDDARDYYDPAEDFGGW